MATKQKTTTTTTALTTWEERLAARAQAAVEQEASVSAGQFISVRAGQLSYDGNAIAGNKMKVVVLDAILENAYYEGKFDPDNPAPPLCYAFGRDDKELAPHEKATKPQHETCKGCPHNEWGSADGGERRGKACKNIRRLALIPAEPLSAEALGKSDVAYFKLPVTSVKAWAAYVRALAALRKRSPEGCVTEISVASDPKTQFKVSFNHVLDLKNELLGVVMPRADTARDEIAFPYPEPQEQEAPAPKGKKRKF